MSPQVFVSYASKDATTALDLYDALEAENISCWLAPKSLPTGSRFTGEIADAIPQCVVLLVLWSQHAAQSAHVDREIGLAAEAGLVIVPLHLDETPYPSTAAYYLHEIQYRRVTEEVGQEGLVDLIREYVYVAEAPYPLGTLYREISRDPNLNLDLERHLEAVRLLVRFVALVLVAGYVKTGRRDPKIDRSIEKLFEHWSLFVDLDVARVVKDHLERESDPVYDALRDFFKQNIFPVPSVEQFERDNRDAQTFDREEIYTLCGGARGQEPSALCPKIRDFLRRSLAGGWPRVCWIRASIVREGGEIWEREVRRPLDLSQFSEEQILNAAISIDLQTGRLELNPYFGLLPTPDRKYCQLALIRSQDRSACFRSLTIRTQLEDDRPPIVLPWARLRVVRKLPDVVYEGEVHSVSLLLENLGFDEIEIGEIEERLPENLRSLQDRSSIRLAGPIVIRGHQRVERQYEIRGISLLGTRSFPVDCEVAFRFNGDVGQTPIRGSREVTVKTLPQPMLKIKREVFGPSGQIWGGKAVSLDSELRMQVHIHSEGAALDTVRVEDLVDGAELTDGELLLHEGPLARLDLQEPVEHSYSLRVCGHKKLLFRTEALCDSRAVSVEGGEWELDILERPPPKFELFWRKVERQEDTGIQAELYVQNIGGTSAYDLTISHDAHASVEVGLQRPFLPRLDGGQGDFIPVTLTLSGLPSGVISFTVEGRSVRHNPIRETIGLPLDRLLEQHLGSLPVVGRNNACQLIRSFLVTSENAILNLHGDRGIGKRRLLVAEIRRLVESEGRSIGIYEIDCRIADSLVECLTKLLDTIVFEHRPQDRGSSKALREFLTGIGMGENDFTGPVSTLEDLIERKIDEPGKQIWYAYALALSKIAHSRGIKPLVILLKGVSAFSAAELTTLQTLRQYLGDSDVRLAVTTHAPLSLAVEVCKIGVEGFTEQDCRAFLDRVFIMPRASETLEKALIEKSESLPANLLSLVTQLVRDPDGLLDFQSPAGVRLRDPERFSNLPTTIFESELKAAERSNIPRAILACVAAMRGPFTGENIEKTLAILNGGDPAAIPAAIEQCREAHWIEEEARHYEVKSATVRAALEEAVHDPDLLERVHQALFMLYEEEGCESDVSFAHLVRAPIEFIREQGERLIFGLRTLVDHGRFSQVRTILSRLLDADIELPAELELELEVLRHELRWEERGDLDSEAAERLLERITTSRPRWLRLMLRARLCLVASRYYNRRLKEYDRAIAAADSAQWRFGPVHWLRVHDSKLEFDFYLNLWEAYYRKLDQRNFRRIDNWLWKRLARKGPEGYDSYAIARFLALFLELQQEFPDVEAHERHFPVEYVEIDGISLPVEANPIESATRTERLKDSFLDNFLAQPDRLNQKNGLVLGRLYLDLGGSLWKKSHTCLLLAGKRNVDADDATALSFLERAESLFSEVGFPLDLAHARRAIGETYRDRIRLMEKRNDTSRLERPCSTAVKWLSLGIDDFRKINAVDEEMETQETLAQVARAWAGHDPTRHDLAIQAYERLVSLPALRHRPDRWNAHRLTLVELYEEVERFEDAARLLDEIGASGGAIAEYRALIHAEALYHGSGRISQANVDELEGDLEILERAKRTDRKQTAGGPRTLAPEALAEAGGLIAWRLVQFHTSCQHGQRALSLLRRTNQGRLAAPRLREELRTGLPRVLPILWRMDASGDEAIGRDFSKLILPLTAAPEDFSGLEEMIGDLWSLERSGGKRCLAAPDVSLMLCESSLDQGYDAPMQAERAEDILTRLEGWEVDDLRDAAPHLARAFTILLRANERTQNDRRFQIRLDATLQELRSAEGYDVGLLMLIRLLEQLLELHGITQNEWYYEVTRRVAVHLQPFQEESSCDFDLVAQLVNLYLQLPHCTTDAADLMERQCSRLLEQQNYTLLARYLSFLSDLLVSLKGRELLMSGLLSFMKDEDSARRLLSDVVADLDENINQGERALAVRKVAMELCGQIIEDLSGKVLDRGTERYLFYNAAKLLEGPETADLRIAINAKLFDMASQVDGPSVWSTYIAWTEVTDELSLDEGIALTTFSNRAKEDLKSGNFGAHPRNYLINAQTRNDLVQMLAKRHPGDRSLRVVYNELELIRLKFLQSIVHDLDSYIGHFDEFDRIEFLTFLYSYVFPTREAVPFAVKIRELRSLDLSAQMKPPLDELHRGGMLDVEHPEEVLEEVGRGVSAFLTGYHAKGRQIMDRVSKRIRPFTLKEILGEVLLHLREGRRAIDFNAVLGLWSAGIDRSLFHRRHAEAARAFLQREPAELIPALAKNGRDLLNQGEEELAERMFRRALNLCEATHNPVSMPRVLRGLVRSLHAQKKPREALAYVEREVSLRENSGDAELAFALRDLGSILQDLGRHDEAIPPLRRVLELRQTEATPDSLQLSSALNNLGVSLLQLGELKEAEEVLRRSVSVRQDFPDPHYWLSRLHRHRGRKGDDALEVQCLHRYLDLTEPGVGRHADVLARLEEFERRTLASSVD